MDVEVFLLKGSSKNLAGELKEVLNFQEFINNLLVVYCKLDSGGSHNV